MKLKKKKYSLIEIKSAKLKEVIISKLIIYKSN